jgi:hypothetical protein
LLSCSLRQPFPSRPNCQLAARRRLAAVFARASSSSSEGQEEGKTTPALRGGCSALRLRFDPVLILDFFFMFSLSLDS